MKRIKESSNKYKVPLFIQDFIKSNYTIEIDNLEEDTDSYEDYHGKDNYYRFIYAFFNLKIKNPGIEYLEYDVDEFLDFLINFIQNDKKIIDKIEDAIYKETSNKYTLEFSECDIYDIKKTKDCLEINGHFIYDLESDYHPT